MKYIFLLAIMLTLAACNGGEVETLSDEAIQTYIAQTLTAQPTSTEASTETLIPTDTPVPTETLEPTSTESPLPTNTPTETLNPVATIPAIPEAECVPRDSTREVGQVTKIIDGDTIEAQIDGNVFRVRYIGIDTPERDQPFGPEATHKNSTIVSGQQVTMVKDVSETDQYDRLLRYVFVRDIFVNYELIKSGYANAVTYPPDVACETTFKEAENMAPTSTTLPPTVPPPPPEPTKKPSGNCDPSYPTVCIPPPPPDLDCGQIPYRRFQVLPPDPHRFDGDNDGIGCESG